MLPGAFSHLHFLTFVIERSVMEDKKKAGNPPPWTSDWVLQQGNIQNIDRRRDMSTMELMRRDTKSATYMIKLVTQYFPMTARGVEGQPLTFLDFCD